MNTTTVSVTGLRDNLSKTIKSVTGSGTPVMVTEHGKPVVMVSSLEDWEDATETLSGAQIASIQQALKENKTGKTVSIEQAFASLEARESA